MKCNDGTGDTKTNSGRRASTDDVNTIGSDSVQNLRVAGSPCPNFGAEASEASATEEDRDQEKGTGSVVAAHYSCWESAHRSRRVYAGTKRRE